MPVNNALANDVWYRYQYLRDSGGHRKFIQKSRTCEDFFQGLQWDAADLALLKAQRRPALTINKIISTVSNVLGEQIFNRTDIAFKPRNEGAKAEVANALSKVFLQISDNNHLPWVRSDVFADGIISGRGFYDVRLDFSDSLKGEVRIEQLNPKNVLIDADADKYDPDEWADVLTTRWMSPDEIELLYGKKDADLLRGNRETTYLYGDDIYERDRDRFGGQNSASGMASEIGGSPEAVRGHVRNVRVIERQWRKLDKVLHYVNLTTGDMRPVPADETEEETAQFLEQNPQYTTTKKLVRRIRWTVVAGNVVLHDEWSPYKHFTVVPFFPVFIRGRTIGMVENLIGPQELLNKVSSQELHVVNTTANSGWKLKANSLKNMTVPELEARGAQSGIVLELDDINSAEKIQPNQTPTGLDRISFKAEEHIKGISGVSDYQTGTAREDVSAKAVQLNQSRGSANMAKSMDNLTRSDTILARNILDLVQQYYTEERLVFITTDQLQNTTNTLRVNERTPEGEIVNDLTVGEYAVVVSSRPERELFEESQFEQALRLRTEAGIPIDDKFIISSSRLKEKNEILQSLEQSSQTPEAQAAAQLKARSDEAAVTKLEAEAADRQADSQLKAARTQKELVEMNKQQAEADPAQMELFKLEKEFEMERARMEQEFQLKREAQQAELQLKREMAAAELEIKRAAAEAEARTKRVAAMKSTARKTPPSSTTTGAPNP